MKKYLENMKKYIENMYEYVENMTAFYSLWDLEKFRILPPLYGPWD